MTIFHLGHSTARKGASTLAVDTRSGKWEPAEPSRVKVFAYTAFSPLWSAVWSLAGLIVSILSFPQYTYATVTTRGLQANPATNTIPWVLPGLAVPISRKHGTSSQLSEVLLKREFVSMEYRKSTVWLKEQADKEDYLSILEFTEVDFKGAVPDRYLNPDGFSSILTLVSLTSLICSFMRQLGGAVDHVYPATSNSEYSNLKGGWLDAFAQRQRSGEDSIVPDTLEPTFEKASGFTVAGYESGPASMYFQHGTNAGTVAQNSGAVFNKLKKIPNPYANSGSKTAIVSPGFICMFDEQLARPDPNLIGDILGRHFLASLGDNREEQFENLAFLKSGIAGLRLTSLGAELTHLYKCIDIAIQSNSGCFPFLSNTRYEGVVICGGTPSSLLVSDRVFQPSSVADLKQLFLTISPHDAAMTQILEMLNNPTDEKFEPIIPMNMVDLRELCLDATLTNDQRDAILRLGSNLRFEYDKVWTINPHYLKCCFDLIAEGPSGLGPLIPISRLVLFSKDIVFIALSCFGEKSCPTWNIPSGKSLSFKPMVPPTPATNQSKGKGPQVDTDWIMVIRKTDLRSATEDFKRMAMSLSYQSIPSNVARKVGHVVMSRDRMAEFWLPLRGALRTANPTAVFETEGKRGEKRVVSDSPGTLVGSPPTVKRMRF